VKIKELTVLLQEEALELYFYHLPVKLIESCPTIFPKLVQHFGMGGLGLWCLTSLSTLSTIFQLYHGSILV
jgi:hypothetical protein